ncbi:unnamed protein product [Amoebophrya sp. A25]|nr:unnamed protein product [Amoebophrya sp. A25]|eukprot:GSA25T00009928001.1
MSGSIAPHVGQIIQKYIVEFMETFDYREENGQKRGYYYDAVREMADENKKTLYLDFRHLDAIGDQGAEHQLSYNMGDLKEVLNYKFYDIRVYLDQAVPQFMRIVGEHNEKVQNYVSSKPHRTWNLAIFNFPARTPLRDLNMEHAGQLREISGTVTRTTETKPEILVGCFDCGLCGNEITNVTQEFKFTLPPVCPTLGCNNKRNFQLKPEADGTEYGDWQRIRVQESEHEIPAGSMPRTLDVILRGEQCETCKAGDKIAITGTLIVVPDVPSLMKPGEMKQSIRRDVNKRHRTNYVEGIRGLRDMGARELTYKVMYVASVIRKLDQDVDTLGNTEDQKVTSRLRLTEEEKERITTISRHVNEKGERDTFDILAQAIAPNVHGHLNVKKGLLLQMIGGVDKFTPEGIKLRSDINVCIIGDPSTAKSQFLKYVASFMPRSVYTSGKTSTAAGLTASVTRDEDGRNMVIEPGALMLADSGICCIDEFDKMDPKDQSAIHEAMEQQTITLSKAGIHATLNAKSSVLAAANPTKNTYDTSKTLAANVNLTAPIMSRFDLFFILLDRPDDRALDQAIAKHLIKMHVCYDHPEVEQTEEMNITQEELRKYIASAQRIQPKITEDSRRVLVRAYKNLRQRSQRDPGAYTITVRQLESLVRLSEAIARLYLEENITSEYVEFALQLMEESRGNRLGEAINLDMDDEEREEMRQEQEEAGGEGDEGAQQEESRPEGETAQGETAGEIGESTAGGQPTAKRKTKARKLDFAEYKRVVSVLMSKLEDVDADGVPGITEDDLIGWYCEKLEDEIENESQLLEKEKETRMIIRRAIHKDHVIIIVEEDPDKQESKNLLKKHPNYVMYTGGIAGNITQTHLEKEKKKKDERKKDK